MSESALLSGEEGSSWAGAGAGGWFSAFCRDDARLVEFEVEDEVESSGISTTFQVCSVASGAKETRRFALSELVSLHESPNMGGGAELTHGLPASFSLLKDCLSFPFHPLLLLPFSGSCHFVANCLSIEAVERVGAFFGGRG